MDKKELIERDTCAKSSTLAVKLAAYVNRRPISDFLPQCLSPAADKTLQHSRTRCTAEIFD